MSETRELLKRRALRLTQGGGRHVFLFSLSPADLVAIADVARSDAKSAGELLGSDRASVKQHVANIQSGVESDRGQMLTSVVLALSPETVFRGSRGPDVSDGQSFAGTLEIPLRTRSGRKPAWILDGYFRLLAFSQTKDKSFAVPVCAFIGDNPAELREQFSRIHSTHPLPANFADVLLPMGGAAISPTIAAQDLPDAVCDWLASNADSPFHNLVEPKGSGKSGTSQFPVSRAALTETIEDSLSTPYGALFPYRNIASGETDIEGLCNAVKSYWSGVMATFPDAWGKSPKKSRLMHPAGIRIMGRVMNRVLPAIDLAATNRVPRVIRELKSIQHLCRWTSGVWEDLDQLAWDRLTNSTRHVNLVANFLLRAYVTK